MKAQLIELKKCNAAPVRARYEFLPIERLPMTLDNIAGVTLKGTQAWWWDLTWDGCLYRLCNLSCIGLSSFSPLLTSLGLSSARLSLLSFSFPLCLPSPLLRTLPSAIMWPVYLQSWRAGNLVGVQDTSWTVTGMTVEISRWQRRLMLPSSITETCKLHKEQWPTVGSVPNIENRP